MKLSEAMRLGAKMVPQAVGKMYYWLDEQNRPVHPERSAESIASADPIGLVVLGRAGSKKAAHKAAYGWHETMPPLGIVNLAEQAWPELRAEVKETLPCGCPPHNRSLFMAVCHLNDTEKWTTEKIADWLEGRGV
jgi:hypothetical protein